MRINWYAIAFITVVLFVAVSAWPDARNFFLEQNLGTPQTQGGYGTAKVKFSELTVTAQVPLSTDLQAKGLGGRTSLADDEGMIWIYPAASEYSFWMKDMVIPLDFLWIKSGVIVDITADVQPPAPGQSSADLPILRPREPVTTILEVPAGFAARHQLSIGDPVEVDRQ